ncbi:hypothetical protein D3C71_845480 [compost metagenome]
MHLPQQHQPTLQKLRSPHRPRLDRQSLQLLTPGQLGKLANSQQQPPRQRTQFRKPHTPVLGATHQQQGRLSRRHIRLVIRPHPLHRPGIRQRPGQRRHPQGPIQQQRGITTHQKLGVRLLQRHFHPLVMRQLHHERRPRPITQRLRPGREKLDKLLGDLTEFRRAGAVVPQKDPHQRTPVLVTQNLHQHRKGATEQRRQVGEHQIAINQGPRRVHFGGWPVAFRVAQVQAHGGLLMQKTRLTHGSRPPVAGGEWSAIPPPVQRRRES